MDQQCSIAWLSIEYARIEAAKAKEVRDAAAKVAKAAAAQKRKSDKAEADARKRQRPDYDAATWEPERSWSGVGVFQPCSYECADGSVVTCACKNKNKGAHLATGVHGAWLAIIRPLEERRRSAAAAAAAADQELSDAGSGESSGSDNDSSHVPVREGLGAVAEALDHADADDAGNDFGDIFDGDDVIAARQREAVAADDDDDNDYGDDDVTDGDDDDE